MKARFVKAFSLVEVVLAIGVMTFCLVGILGLLSTAFETSRRSASDLTIVAMAEDVRMELRTRPFDNLQQEVSGSGVNYYFREDGSRLQSPTGEMPIYQCAVTGRVDAAMTATNANLLALKAVFSRYGASGSNNVFKTVPFFFARYD